MKIGVSVEGYTIRLDYNLKRSRSDYPGANSAVSWALQCLRSELSPDLTYHSLWHTEDDVLPAVVRLANQSGITSSQLQLLEIAAAFHDLGFVDTYSGHEKRGALIVAEVLPDYGFSSEQIAQVQGMILATDLERPPQTLLECLLADADLDYLGRDDFFQRNEALFNERRIRGDNMSRLEWRIAQLRFLQSHSYCSSAARSLRQSSKEAHIVLLHNWINTRGYRI